MSSKDKNIVKHGNGLVGALGLLERLFENEAERPSLRWLRGLQAKKEIPYIKIGNRVFFDLDEVRTVLAEKYTVRKEG